MRSLETLLQTGRWSGLWMLAVLLPQLACADTLRVLSWPGYADADLVRAFEARTSSQVNITYIDSDDALWERVQRNNGQDFDVFAVNTAELQRYVRALLVAPIDIAQIPNTARQLPRFRQLERISGLVHQGQLFGVPYTYAEMGLIYDRQKVKTPPTSIAALWDPQYRGKVLLYNGSTHNFSLTAQSMGISNPFQLASKQWPAVVNQLIGLRRNALGFYTQPDESVALFRQKGATLMLANYGSQQLQLLRAAGADVGYAIPKEGTLAWLDTWAITRQAKNTALAHAWINYLLEAAPSQALEMRQGLANTVNEPSQLRPTDRLVWLQPVEDSARRQQLWERIYSGDRAAKVLAP
ncbi:extracellular solute-binding protein [Rhodoferax antarcticus]|uniref:Bacterial extracellular solute-binding family protein n=1 Tax=Rhodoferax antarcticus ANT.BR TaxID=1111071 RepID=A0A1Q8YDR3_9BURK|nr:extracellular solute-binding protein [Rhodoferax antarcticus]APW45917.1 spermidine/putrescine ABC transporter substrate-binding protein [Rhodoferax antarcticus]MCW2310542.1 putative spermidine/putrescine transport system substrate-binding protein [Rhodoferax antarcticus]OLP06029.1 bacterial extracellular solute-binding family protein [Rhodoferax antarcticus ANT.BR]